MTRLDAIASRGAIDRPDRPAIVVPAGAGPRATVLTYDELDRAASEFAAALGARGAAPGDRLVLANANTPEFFVALFGAARAGLVAMPLDAGLAPAELRAVLERVRPHAAVADPVAAGVLAPLGVPLCKVADAAGTLAVGAPLREAQLCDARRGGSSTFGAPRTTPREPRAQPASTDPALLLYTSGTTGTPRGAVHTHAGILRKVEDIRAWFALGEADRAMCMLPTHFGHGLVSACLTILHAGGTLVLCRRFDAMLLPRVFELADTHGVATFSTVPTIVRLMLRDPAIRPPAAGTLRYVTCASAPLHPEEVDAFEARFGVPLLNCYGMTEAGTWSAMSPIDPARSPARDRRSVGIAVGCRFRAVAVDGDARRPLPDGEVGELEVSGPSVMVGYDGDPAATAGALRDGWLATGDLGHVDGEGRVFLSGRAKDLIIRAGANIYPAEVERALLCHAQVAEAYVVGLDHAVLGEQVAACVVRRPGAEVSDVDLLRHCRTLLAPYKCPEAIRFVDTVPKTSRGKVSRAALQDVFARTDRTAPG